MNNDSIRRAILVVGVGALAVSSACAQPSEDLARYFGFDPVRIIVVDDNFGPVVVDDLNGDGRPDLIVVNNSKSRIEVHSLREREMSDAERDRNTKANDLPPNAWYDRSLVSVASRVSAIRVLDIDGDSNKDLVYAGANPNELVCLRQHPVGTFKPFGKRRVSGLAVQQAGFRIADVAGDGGPEIIATADSKIAAFSLGKDGVIGDPVTIGSTGDLVAAFTEDYNGDGLTDILGAAPDDSRPLRLWLQRQDSRATSKMGLLPAELRFEMPELREVEPVRFPGRKAASIGVIERASNRIVFFDLSSAPVEQPSEDDRGIEREVQAEVSAFSDDSSKDRSVIFADLNGDGLTDLLANDFKNNTIAFHAQGRGLGVGQGEQFSAFKNPKTVGAGQWDGAGPPEVFVLSEEEKAVGVAVFDPASGRLGFPVPLPIKTEGSDPVSMSYLDLNGTPTLAVIVKDKRDHALELHQMLDGAEVLTAVKLADVSRAPQGMLACDADQDGRTDILLFTPDQPLVMIRATGESDPEKAWMVLTEKSMPQVGLVQDAGPANTALLDVNGDGKAELLVATKNFVRACSFEAGKGWKVIEQITVADVGTSLVGLTTFNEGHSWSIFASDKGNGRIVKMVRRLAGGKDAWIVSDRMKVVGFPMGPIHAGSFGGDEQASLMCISDEGFALVRLAGTRADLVEFAAYRSDNEDRAEHEIEIADVNNDDYVDAVVLDEGEQMCEIFTFSAARKLHHATEFEVFQSRLFSGGASRDAEPRSANLADVTGDGLADIILTVHDRLMIYPQMKKAK